MTAARRWCISAVRQAVLWNALLFLLVLESLGKKSLVRGEFMRNAVESRFESKERSFFFRTGNSKTYFDRWAARDFNHMESFWSHVLVLTSLRGTSLEKWSNPVQPSLRRLSIMAVGHTVMAKKIFPREYFQRNLKIIFRAEVWNLWDLYLLQYGITFPGCAYVYSISHKMTALKKIAPQWKVWKCTK